MNANFAIGTLLFAIVVFITFVRANPSEWIDRRRDKVESRIHKCGILCCLLIVLLVKVTGGAA